ncbi:MAG: hypothetical protein RIF39_16010 [Cyclobacteriaceae bacterium]
MKQLIPNDNIWHNDSDIVGSVVFMWFDPKTNIGRIFMTNYFVNDAIPERNLELYGKH